MAGIEDESDVEAMQNDLDKVYKWAESNNMEFNSKKFELLRYGQNEELKVDTLYFSADNNIIEEKDVLGDLGVQMNNKATFDEHIVKVCQSVKQKAGWILRTFKSRNPYLMKHLWKQLVQPHIDYCSQLYMPVNGGKLADIENLQRNFTTRIPSVRHLDYWARLKELKLISQQRRLERYRIIYVWKVLEGMVPNCGIESEDKGRLGRSCILPNLKKNSSVKIQTLRENSFQVHGPKLFNCLPPQLRNLTKCSVIDFKTKLDLVLEMVPDEPNVTGCEYTPRACDQFNGNPSNSIIDQIRSITFTIPSKIRSKGGS